MQYTLWILQSNAKSSTHTIWGLCSTNKTSSYGKDKYKFLLLSFVGGELFHRPDIKELYKGFEDTAKTLELMSMRAETFNARVFSNLLFEDTSPLEHFLYAVDAKNNDWFHFRSSFDLYDRFTSDAQVDLFVRNLEKISGMLKKRPKIKVIITKSVIDKFNTNDYTFQVFKELVKSNKYKFMLNKFNIVDSGLSDRMKEKFNVEYPDYIKWCFTDLYESLGDKNTKFTLAFDHHVEDRLNLIVGGHYDDKFYKCRENARRILINH